MKFYFDESGSFKVPDDPAKHSVGIVSGVVIPESQEAQIFREFNAFVATLPQTAFKDGEPKGRLLDDGKRADLVTMITDLPIGILLCPIVIDLTSLAGKSDAKISSDVSQRLTELKPTCVDPEFRKWVQALALKTGAMSNQQMLRLYAWARCVYRCVQDSIFWYSFPGYLGDWSELRFEIDPVQQNGGTEAEVFDFMLRQWIIAWCQQRPLMIARETLTPNHPFMKKYDTPKGIDAKKIFDNNIHYVPSNKSTGIQLADMTATIIRRAIVNSSVDTLFDYGMLMTRTLGDTRRAAGVSFFGTREEREAAEVRYQGMGNVIEFVRQRIPNSYAMA